MLLFLLYSDLFLDFSFFYILFYSILLFLLYSVLFLYFSFFYILFSFYISLSSIFCFSFYISLSSIFCFSFYISLSSIFWSVSRFLFLLYSVLFYISLSSIFCSLSIFLLLLYSVLFLYFSFFYILFLFLYFSFFYILFLFLYFSFFYILFLLCTFTATAKSLLSQNSLCHLQVYWFRHYSSHKYNSTKASQLPFWHDSLIKCSFHLCTSWLLHKR